MLQSWRCNLMKEKCRLMCEKYSNARCWLWISNSIIPSSHSGVTAPCSMSTQVPLQLLVFQMFLQAESQADLESCQDPYSHTIACSSSFLQSASQRYVVTNGTSKVRTHSSIRMTLSSLPYSPKVFPVASSGGGPTCRRPMRRWGRVGRQRKGWNRTL
jgi:hypothetical protein